MRTEEDVIDDVTRCNKEEEKYHADDGQDQPDFCAAAAAGLGFSTGSN